MRYVYDEQFNYRTASACISCPGGQSDINEDGHDKVAVLTLLDITNTESKNIVLESAMVQSRECSLVYFSRK